MANIDDRRRQVGSVEWTTASGPLLLLTRPPREARVSARALASRGYASLSMPLQYTRNARLTPRLQDELRWAEGAEIQIFVSRASVVAACALAPGAVSAAVLRFAIGRASAEALASHGHACFAAPADAEDSQGLLDLPALAAVAGRHVVLWIAPGGRQLIAQTLRERGAEVHAIAVYQRVDLDPKPALLQRLQEVADRLILTTTSAALTARLAHTLRAHGLSELMQRPLIVASERIAVAAEALGFERVYVARGASPEALIGAVGQLTGAVRTR
jgi:uroporphyrinogen-III synthase